MKGRCADTGEGVCTSAGADEKGIAYVGECKRAGGVSEGWPTLSRAILILILPVFFVGVLISERGAAVVDDDEGRCSWLRPRFGLDEERLKNSQNLRMAKRVDVLEVGKRVGGRMRRFCVGDEVKGEYKYKGQWVFLVRSVLVTGEYRG